MPGQVTGVLGDQHDDSEVVEQFERPDHALARLLAVRAGRLPQGPAKPGPALLPHASQHLVSVWRGRLRRQAQVQPLDAPVVAIPSVSGIHRPSIDVLGPGGVEYAANVAIPAPKAGYPMGKAST